VTFSHPLLLAEDIQGLIFDLDGTLLDSAKDILQGMRETFVQAGIGQLPDDYFPDNLAGTGENIIRSVFNDMGWTIPVDLQPFYHLFAENYSKLNLRNTQLYPFAADVLQAGKAAHLHLGVCTNKTHASALTATKHFGIDTLFSFITGADTWAAAKPSPIPLLETIRMLGLRPEQCLYFGDTSVDAECAQDAGVRFALHTMGYGEKSLKNASNYLTFERWEDLLNPPPQSNHSA
jgi:HAD superfamily hydrolase (TIGR01549 family)